MYTYVFAYYLSKNNQSVIFEVRNAPKIQSFSYKCIKFYFFLKDNQRDLESATEMLSEYLERDITQENMADIKQKVQDKYR